MLSAHDEISYVTRLFAHGSKHRGFLLKDRANNAAALCDALDRVGHGESVIDNMLVGRLMERQQGLNQLTELTRTGAPDPAVHGRRRSNAGIARVTCIAEKTIESNITRISPSSASRERQIATGGSWLSWPGWPLPLRRPVPLVGTGSACDSSARKVQLAG